MHQQFSIKKKKKIINNNLYFFIYKKMNTRHGVEDNHYFCSPIFYLEDNFLHNKEDDCLSRVDNITIVYE